MIVAADDVRKLVELRPELSAPTSPVVAQSEIIKQMVADIDGDNSQEPLPQFPIRCRSSPQSNDR